MSIYDEYGRSDHNQNNSRSRWLVKDSHFDPSWCNSFVNEVLHEVEPLPPFVGGQSIGISNDKVRECEIRWLGNDPLNGKFQHVFEAVLGLIRQVNRDFWAFHIDDLYEIQFTTYKFEDGQPANHYDWHQDIIWSNGVDKMSERKVSCVVQLSDPSTYEGGKLIVDPTPQGPLPTAAHNQGSVTLFDSFLQHKVTPVTKGIRHSLVAWAEGPRWR